MNLGDRMATNDQAKIESLERQPMLLLKNFRLTHLGQLQVAEAQISVRKIFNLKTGKLALRNSSYVI